MRRLPIAVASLVTALPDFALAGLFLATWIAPGAMGPTRLRQLVLVMLVEFLVVHAAAFMGSAAFADGAPRRRAKAVLGLGGLYTLFAGGFALAFRAWWPVLLFWGLTLNRLLGVVLGQAPSGAERALIQRGWGVATLCYLLAVCASAFLPVPALGVDRAAISAAQLPSSGLWIEQPQRALAAGVLYFTALGLWELMGSRWPSATSRTSAPARRADSTLGSNGT